ncbi:YDR239C [Zygosaccharomyces parabailii]|nr:YDR239C [Zygosaccharomyces parabailii]
MFSSSSGSNKGKRRSFFLWGGSTSFVSNHPTGSSSTNVSYSSTTTKSYNSKASPMKVGDKKLVGNKNPSSSSDKSTSASHRLTTERPNTIHSSSKDKTNTSTGVRHSDSSPSKGPSSPSTRGKHKHSSSHKKSHDKHRDASSHRHTKPAHNMSPDKEQSSSPKKVSKDPSKQYLAKDLPHDGAQDETPPAKDRKLSVGRRPPPPVELSVIKSSIKILPQNIEEECDANRADEESVTALDYVERGVPLLTLKSNHELNQIEEAVETEEACNPRQHRRQRSEAEKLVDDLDDFIKEHSEVHDSPPSPGREIQEELDRRLALQNVLDTEFMDHLDFNSDDAIDSPLTFVGPLKLPDVSASGPPATEPATTKTSIFETSLTSSPPLHAPSSTPLLNSAPDSVSGAVPPASLEKKSGTSVICNEQNDTFSFTNSLNDESVKSVQQVALSETAGAAPIVSNLSCHNSVDFSVRPGEIVHLNQKGLEIPPLMNKDSLQRTETDSTECTTNPFFQKSQIVDLDLNVLAKATDSEEAISKVFDDDTKADSLTTEEHPPRRKFRVVNEDRPTFYMNGLDDSIPQFSKDKDAYYFDDTATHSSFRSHESASSKGFSVSGSEKSIPYTCGFNNQSTESTSPSAGMRSAFVSLDSVSENEIAKNMVNSSKTKEGTIPAAQISLSNHQSVRSVRSNNSSTTVSSNSPKSDKTVRLVSSYVEELRLKYDRTSNFLQAPPNLPVTLKQKNNLIQPKNIKVKIRTSSKQIGIKHGRAKQKLLTLETAEEDGDGSMKILSHKNKINVDHTKEFHNLLHSRGSPSKRIEQEKSPSKSKNDEEEFLNDIPGDDAYDSDDAMAPLREKRHTTDTVVTRSSTVKSYFTKQQEKLQSVNEGAQLNKLPTNINIQDYLDNEPKIRKKSTQSGDSGLEAVYSYGQGLRVANPDSESD